MAEPRTNELPQWIAEHIRRYQKNGDEGHLWDASLGGGKGLVPTLLLTTTGRKSGEPRVMPLIYGKTPTGYAIVASKGGYPSHPVWYLNLLAQPKVRVQVANDKFEAKARVTRGAERAAIWKQMAAIYAPYDDYQKRTKREIPVVVLEPVKS
jgi:deazaflavin-dependent oxidoreductase (nitroreductase family)